MKKLLVFLTVLLFTMPTSYAQKWVDMGTKADNGAPMYWSSYDLVINNKSEWVVAKNDTLIGVETSWSSGYDGGSIADISGNERYDRATMSLGKPYRMPSQREWDRLLANCDVSYYSVKVKNSRIIPFEPNIRDMSWLYGTWTCVTSSGLYITAIMDKDQLILRNFFPGIDPLPDETYRGPYTIYMNRIEFKIGGKSATLRLDINKRELYTYDGFRFKNEHEVRRGPTRIPAKWIDYMQLKSRINGNTLVFPLVKYSSDDEYNATATESPYLSNHSNSICWWSSTSANVDYKYLMEVNESGPQIQTAYSGKNCKIRPVYDDGHKNPSKYPNDFGWLQVDVDRFSEGRLDIYLDDSLLGNAPYHKELKVNCGSHKVRITGDRIKELQNNINVGYREICAYHPSITSKYAKVTIRSSECEIQIDGKHVGSYSWTGELEAGKYKVKVIKACYEPYEETITVVGGRDASFDITPNRLKKHALNVSCNADNCKVQIDGQTKSLGSSKPISLNLEMKTTHTLSIEAQDYVPLTVTFYILEDEVVCQNQQKLDSYDGEQSSVVKSDLEELEIHLSKLNKRLYYGNDARFKQRPNYTGANMGVDRIRINELSIGSEIAYRRVYYLKSRIMFSGAAGLALMPRNEDASLVLLEDTEFALPIEYFIGLGAGWQVFRGTGLRITPQIEVVGYSLFDDPYIAVCPKVNVSYPISEKFVIGLTPMMGCILGYIADFSPYDWNSTFFGMSLTLGWQKRK